VTASGWMDIHEMTHPALTVLPWDHTEADTVGVHGIAVFEVRGGGPCAIDCYCGARVQGDTAREAVDALVAHAEGAAPDADQPAPPEPEPAWSCGDTCEHCGGRVERTEHRPVWYHVGRRQGSPFCDSSMGSPIATPRSQPGGAS
jgi:hypothetical protein